MANKPKTIGAIQKAFLLQTNRLEESTPKVSIDVQKEPPLNWLKEKNILEDKIKALQNEKQHIQTKYDKLKTKHVGLLQTLFSLEEKNQNLESILSGMKTKRIESGIESNSEGLEATSSPSCEIDQLNDLVNILQYLKEILLNFTFVFLE